MTSYDMTSNDNDNLFILGYNVICIHDLFMVLTPYLHVYGVHVCFIFLSDMFDVVRGGSHSHILVRIYMMYHSPLLPIYLRYICTYTCPSFMQVTGTRH